MAASSPEDCRIILASKSERRRKLLSEARVPFDVVPPEVDEPQVLPPGLPARSLAEALAYFKAASVVGHSQDMPVLGADTIVSLQGQVLGKPTDAEEARRMLRSLSGTRHAVITGVALLCPDGRRIASDVTHVTMRCMSDAEMEQYIESCEWAGKAGAYAIQETADRFVERVEGSFTNVVGLPMELVERLLRKFVPGAWPD